MFTRLTRCQVLVQLAAVPMGLMMLPTADQFVSPLDPAWTYTNGSWTRTPEPNLPT